MVTQLKSVSFVSGRDGFFLKKCLSKHSFLGFRGIQWEHSKYCHIYIYNIYNIYIYCGLINDHHLHTFPFFEKQGFRFLPESREHNEDMGKYQLKCYACDSRLLLLISSLYLL